MEESILNVTGTTLNPEGVKIMFSWFDYFFFILMLALSTLIGLYFGCFGKKQSSADEYLLGGKTMSPLPIAAALVSSQTSGIALLSVPADVYGYGATYILTCVAILMSSTGAFLIFLPVFHKLQITSVYEYLKLRFDTRIRLFASFLFSLATILYLPIVIYVPALALTQATDININVITLIVCAVCVFYTTIGGLKAVVWTDLLQFSVTIGGMGAVLYLGVVSAGGLGEIFKKSKEGKRLDIDFDINPLTRDTFWALMVGYNLASMSHLGTSQHCVQKFLAVSTMQDVKKALIYFIIGIIMVKSSSVFTGLIIYARYADCDPISSGSVRKADQLLPYYVLDVAGSVPGLPGLFLSGVFCAALSTLSAVMNTVAGTLYEDFVSRFMPKTITQKQVSNVLKILVVTIGVISTSLVFIVDHLGNIMPLSMKFGSLTAGPLMGIFAMGLLLPQVNSKGALCGGIFSLLFMSWILIGAELSKMQGLIPDNPKPLSTAQCNFTFVPKNVTINSEENNAFFLYRLSHYYYTVCGGSVAIICGLIVSWLTQSPDEPPVSKDVLSPIIHRFLTHYEKPKKEKYYSIDKALHIVVNNIKLEEKEDIMM